LEKPPAATPREFALQAEQRWQAEPRFTAHAELPTRVVEAYYRWRYAGEDVPAEHAAELSAGLASLEAAARQA
jgi:hypothetical protein